MTEYLTTDGNPNRNSEKPFKCSVYWIVCLIVIRINCDFNCENFQFITSFRRVWFSIKPPPLSNKPHYPLNDRLYYSITTVKHRVDWSGMVYSPTGSSYLFLIFGWMTSTFMSLRFSTLHSSFFGELISSSVLSKWNMLPLSNKPPVSIKPPRPPPQIGLK